MVLTSDTIMNKKTRIFFCMLWTICIGIFFFNISKENEFISSFQYFMLYGSADAEDATSSVFYAQHGLNFSNIHRANSNARVQYVRDVNEIRHFDVLVVGAGLSGAVIAERYAKMGVSVLIIEKRNHIAGNCYDYVDSKTGIRMNEYGAHLFHTNDKLVWKYVNNFCTWTRFDHRVLAYVDEKYVPVPVNINTVNLLFNDTDISNSDEMTEWLNHERQYRSGVSDSNFFMHEQPRNSEEMAISRVGKRLYEKIFKPYTEKQWNTTPKELDASVTGRIPVRTNFDDRYFSDKYQGLPDHGYTALVKSMLSHEFISVWLNQDFFDLPAWISATAKKIYYTGPIDRYFGETGSLEYRSLLFEKILVSNHRGFVLPAPVVNYPSLEFPHTRIVEYKQLPMQISNYSILVKEYPSATGEPYYPIPTARNRLKYLSLCNKMQNMSSKTVFVGRLANYKYFNMDNAIKNSLEVFWNETRRLHVIITKFKEDLAWMPKFCLMLKNVRVAWFVYMKNPNETAFELKSKVEKLVNVQGCATDSVTVINHTSNVGREGLAWAEYMLTHGADFDQTFHGPSLGLYRSGEDLTKLGILHVFLQGNEETRLSKVVHFVHQNIFKPELGMDMEAFDYIECDTNYEFRPASFLYKEYVDIVRQKLNWTLPFCYCFRGEFGVTTQAIERFAKTHRHLFESVIIPKLKQSNDPLIGHLLERIWILLLLPPEVWSQKYSHLLQESHYFRVVQYFLEETFNK